MVRDLRLQPVLGDEPLEVREPLRVRVVARDVLVVHGVADPEPGELARHEAGVADAEHEVPVAVAAERSVQRAELRVEPQRIGDRAREDRVVHPHRLGGRVVVEHLARRRRRGRSSRRGTRAPARRRRRRGAAPRWRGIVPPVVVVEPAEDLALRALDPGRARVDLARAGARDRARSAASPSASAASIPLPSPSSTTTASQSGTPSARRGSRARAAAARGRLRVGMITVRDSIRAAYSL